MFDPIKLTYKVTGLVIDSRMILPMEKDAMPRLNYFGNKISAGFFSWLLGQDFTDTLCGVKALFRSDHHNIDKHRAYFGNTDPWGGFDLILGAAKLRLKIAEIPVRYRSRSYGVSQIRRWKDTQMLICTCIIAALKIKNQEMALICDLQVL